MASGWASDGQAEVGDGNQSHVVMVRRTGQPAPTCRAPRGWAQGVVDSPKNVTSPALPPDLMAKARPVPRGARAAWRDYLLALGAVAAALALRYLLNPILGQQGPYLILTLAVVVPALYGGF